jgi:hypothetical protein
MSDMQYARDVYTAAASLLEHVRWKLEVYAQCFKQWATTEAQKNIARELQGLIDELPQLWREAAEQKSDGEFLEWCRRREKPSYTPPGKEMTS